MIKLAPSILSADFNILGEQIKKIEKAGVEYLHIDVMDGSFVPSISFGMPVMTSIKKDTNLTFDVHLMIDEPIRYLKEFKKAGADIITVHAEACKHLHRTVTQIKELGCRAGVSLNPATPIDVLDCIIEELDMVLIMSVNPGFGGQKFIPNAIDKIRKLKEKTNQMGLSLDIEVDGGISTANVEQVLEAGANVIVSGTSIFSGNIDDNIKEYRKIFSGYDVG